MGSLSTDTVHSVFTERNPNLRVASFVALGRYSSAVISGGDDAAKWLDEQAKAMESALAELVEVNSFTENTDGGQKVGVMLEELFSSIDMLDVNRIPSTTKKFADHLVVSSSWTSTGDAPIALIGHLDTVFPPGTFEGYKRDGDLARGPGVLDMKGGLVVVAWALKALAETGALALLPGLRVVIVSDEEVGSPESRDFRCSASQSNTV